MRAWRSRSPRARLAIGLGLVALLLAVAYVAFRIATRESAEPASVSEAIGRFRARGDAARELPPALRGHAPEPGTYVYATAGAEVSQALGTRRHAYPPRTTITVTAPSAHCLRTRWDVLSTRWDAVEACRRVDGGWQLISQSESHEFAGHRDERSYRCTPASTWRPAHLTTGTTWSSSCAIEGTTTADASTVVGSRTLAVAGRPIHTVLLTTRTRVSGDTTGTGTTRTWVVPATGLIVRRTIANASSTDTLVGDVPYVERATLRLTSRRPRR